MNTGLGKVVKKQTLYRHFVEGDVTYIVTYNVNILKPRIPLFLGKRYLPSYTKINVQII